MDEIVFFVSLFSYMPYFMYVCNIQTLNSIIKGDYIRQYPNSIGMFKKIIVDKAINQVSVRYNIKVNKEKQSSRCLNDDCSDKTIYRAATRCEYEHALNKLHGCLTNGIRFYF